MQSSEVASTFDNFGLNQRQDSQQAKAMSHQVGAQTSTCHLAGYPVNQSWKLAVCHGIATTLSITAETRVSLFSESFLKQ